MYGHIYIYSKNQVKITYRYFKTLNVEINFHLFRIQLGKN